MLKPLPRGLLLILVGSFLLRIGLVIVQPMTRDSLERLPDQREYYALAENVLRHGSLSFYDPRVGQRVYAYRMPGYPAFLVACAGSISVARFAQCLLDSSTVLATFLLAVRLTACTRLGRIAALLMAANPFYIFFSSLLLSETLFDCLLIWAIYFLLRLPSRTAIVGLGMLVAATYVRPIGYALLPAVGFAAALNLPRRTAYHLPSLGLQAGRLTLFYVIILFFAMVPWAYRNHKLFGQWVWTTTNGGITLYDGFHAGATGASDQRFLADMPAVLTMNEVKRSSFFAVRARDWIATNPRSFAILSLKKIARTWSPVPLSQDFSKPSYVVLSAVFSIPFDLLCLVGLFSPRLSAPAKFLMVTPAAIVTLGVVLSVGSIRYRMPAEATMAIVAAAGAMDVFKRRKFEVRNLEASNQ